jgi:SecD/SecF fusion protein
VLDGKLYSAPTVREEINSDSAQISGGNMSDREALNLANVLNNPLDVELVVKQQYEVGPSLAADAISSGQLASVVGVALVAGFMVTYYTVGGLLAVITLPVQRADHPWRDGQLRRDDDAPWPRRYRAHDGHGGGC